ncbi:T9SS type A sorting domain-containing protein [Rubrivirga sp. IMCC43871]|uniref:T9SS type A sorting domain-containing protein n=1 Tax=Rubrivirga sp. IMCC43871 TaxID=3391575 RepID=UPI00398FFE71
MRTLAPLLLALAVATSASAQIDLTEPTCATNGEWNQGNPAPTVPNGHIAWPADDPVWEFDVYRPANRTTVNSSGLELRDVRYRGRLILARASVPVLNVEYDAGGCGCFRDWMTDEAPIELSADAVLASDCGLVSPRPVVNGQRADIRSGIAVSAPGAVRTSCEANEDPGNTSPGGDVGDFEGISVEDYGSELVLTGHTEAGWYRYRMKWHFYADGRIWPEFSFAAADAVCTGTAHRHHAYWRLDFDLDGTAADDIITEHGAGGALAFTQEASRVLGGPSDATYWSVVDGASGIGYEIRPGDADRRLPVDPFSKIDALVLRYKMDEIEDGATISSGGCAFAYEPFLDGESVENVDTVFWIRSGALHSAGAPFECDVVGPMLVPIGFEVSAAPGTRGVEFEAARPNPFQRTTTTRFRVETTEPVTAELYDLAGRRVQVLFDGVAPGGQWQSLLVDGRTLPAGTYVIRLQGESVQGTTRVVLVR